MQMKKELAILLLCCTSHIMRSQQGGIGTPIGTGNSAPVSLPLAPEAYNHLRFDINPVNLNTGIPDITEPLYTFLVDSHINLNIDLRYHPSGLRVKEVSGLAGQGWNTFSPGTITREVNGLPDEKFTYGILNSGFINTLNTYGLSNPQTTKYLYDSKVGKEDVQYDLFHFNFLNHSGSFKLNHDGSTEYLGTSGNYRIEFVKSNDNLFFTITDDKGYSYVFDKKRSGYDNRTIEKVLRYEHSCGQIQMPPAGNDFNPNSTWYLTQIKNPQNVVICSFSYDAYTEIPPNTVVENFNVRLGGVVNDVQGLGASGDCNDGVIFCNHKSLLPEIDRTVIGNDSSLALTKITVPGKGWVDYEIIGNKIHAITVRNEQNAVIKKISLDYLSFASSGRHFLNSAIIKNRSESQVYKYGFQYNHPDLFPGKTSDIADFWGYYNGRSNTDLIVRGHDIILDNKRADKEAVKTGMLTRIILPTGGYKEFEFESNTYSKELSNPDMIFDEDENREATSTNLSKTVFNTNQQLTNGLVYFKDAQEINVHFNASQFQRPEDIPAVAISLIPIKLNPLNPNLITQAEIDNAEEETENNTLLPRPAMNLHINSGTAVSNSFYTKGYYKIKYIVNVDGILQYYPVTYGLNINYYNLVDNIRYNYGGGLRIKKISVSDGQNIYHKNYNYHQIISSGQPSHLPQLTSTLSSGEIINKPVYKKMHSYNYLSVTAVNSLTGPVGHSDSQNYVSANSLGYSSVNAIKGSFVNYKNVTVSDEKGKIENTFSVYSDYPDITYTSLFSPTYKFLQQDYKIGLLKADKVYDSNGHIVKETEYEYDTRDFSKNLLYKVIDNNGGCFLQNGPLSHRVKDYDSFMSSQNANPHPSSECGSALSNSIMLASEVKYGFAGVKKTTEREFSGVNVLEKINSTSYNSRFYTENNKTEIPSGEKYETTYQYAHEKGNSKLINANMIGINLETKTVRKQNASDAGKTISRTETKYDNVNHLFPSSLFSYDYQNNASQEVTFDQYDNKGNILQYTTKEGISTTIIWGYNENHPIAKVQGMKLSEIPQSYIDAVVNASDSDAANPANEPALITALDNFRKEASFAGMQITTYTYDPLIGVTSITPPSGIREVYIYDTANRLEKIVDINGKVLKEFKYNYKP